jgi:nitroreductase
MDLHDALYGRRSVRSYTADPVSQADLEYVIDAAIQAPSAMNEQALTFTVIRSAELLDRISRQAKAHLLAQSAFGITPGPFRNRIADPAFQIFYHAPALILISAVTESEWAVENCTLAAENLMLAAYARGLGSCWIGFAQHWLQTGDGKIAVRLPNHHRPVAPIVVGHPASEPDPVQRHQPTIQWRD